MVTSMCIYRVRPGAETAFRDLLSRHWPTLRGLDLATDDESKIYEGREEDGAPLFVEFLTWKDAEGPGMAHELPEVMAVWEPMGDLCESRGGRPAMEFPQVRPADIRFDR
jgi:hypothetical protein